MCPRGFTAAHSQPSLGALTELTSSLSPWRDFSRTRAPIPPLTRISSPMWYFRMLVSSLAFAVRWQKKETLLCTRGMTGEVKGQEKMAVVSSEQDNSLNKQKRVPSAHCVHSPQPTHYQSKGQQTALSVSWPWSQQVAGLSRIPWQLRS